jgi:asparagine synthase (glutamine-hydrolysing)
MTDAMTHRGPNDRGTYQSEGVALGVRRLSIVDVEGGHQPFSSEDKTVWAVQNGELYNHESVRGDLMRDGHVFRTRCDTEVIPHLYERDGERFEESLRGKFGIAVWDGTRRRLVVARDRLGIKPLYYARRGDLVVFASELKGLLASGLVDPELDYDAIDSFLTLGYMPAPMTPLAGVFKLLPGHRLVVDADGVRTERYWSYPVPEVAMEPLSLDDYAGGLLEVLDDSVRMRLMSDVPLGAMLSGGLDSSLIVALMARHMSEPVKTFSVGFAEAGGENELGDARMVSSLFATDHHELELSFADAAIDLEDLLWAMDEPLADLSAVGFLALSELAARHVTVALSGQGADELVGGYLKHQAASLVPAWHRLPQPLRRLGEAAALRGPRRFHRTARTLAADGPVERLLAMSGQLDGDLRGRLLHGPLAERDGSAARSAVRARLGGVDDDPLPATLHLDGQLALPDDMLQYFDRASMAHSLEVRVPFLDHEVVEFCATIPGNLKVRRLVTKVVLKHAARGLLPDQIVDKRKIGFFRGTTNDWLGSQLRGRLAESLLGRDARTAEFLDRREVERLVQDHLSGRNTRNSQLLLSILMLEVWLSSYVPRATRPAPEPVALAS